MAALLGKISSRGNSFKNNHDINAIYKMIYLTITIVHLSLLFASIGSFYSSQ